MKRLLVVAIGRVAGLNPVFGQNFQDGSRWFNVPSWKATLTGSGNGEGLTRVGKGVAAHLAAIMSKPPVGQPC